MNKTKKENKRELFYSKYKKSTIFDSSNTKDIEKNNKTVITDKITNRKYDKTFYPKMDNLSSRQRYIQSLYKYDLNEFTYTPKKSHSKIKRNIIRSHSVKNTNKIKNYYSTSLNGKNNIIIKKKIQLFRENSINNEKMLNILKTTTNHKIRSLFSNYSNIFNNNNNSSSFYKQKIYSTLISHEGKNKGYMNKTPDDISHKIKALPIKLIKIKNSKNYLQRELILKNNIIKSERQKEELLRKKVKEKNFNKKKIENNKNELLSPIYSFKLETKNKKTAINNLESVNYNIINNKKSNIRQDYINLSSNKPIFENVSNYEIIIPKKFNQVNELKLKNILHSVGIHFFSFTEQGDIISGSRGKYLFKIRNTKNDKNFRDKIKIINSKFTKLNVKLKKTNLNYSKKKTDLIPNTSKKSIVKNNKNKKIK